MNSLYSMKILNEIERYISTKHPERIEEFRGISNVMSNKNIYLWIDTNINKTEELNELMKDYFFSIH
ncbi:hypothetical protein A1QC_10945 [Vibrio rumoiensis 1S-45]|uniref:Uncharacterized protein n=1 Tax=Vibrio rumoiensis 1S-45 TaxID=1188252 RepID=A0A1E5E0W2_9VIBR|nr:hypothetical protein A1QC_10945 [Vibrio rumoiensis 1S-45]